MPRISKALRDAVYRRDGNRCVHCGTSENLTFQHRAAVGFGGSGKKAVPLTPADGVTMCLLSNVEAEGSGQSVALASGWKIRRWRGGIPASELPYRDAVTGLWWLPDTEGFRHQVTVVEAQRRLRAGGA